MNRRPFSSRFSSVRPAARRLLTATLMIVTSCLGGDKSPTAPVTRMGEPQFLISDGTRPGGTVGFYFLPPMVSNPTFTGTFDYDIAAINPVVAICDVTSGPDVSCGSSMPGATPAIRTFTTTTDPAVTVDFEKYKVNWDTGEEGFVPGRVYRIHVFVGPARQELGFADVALTQTPGQVKKSSGEIIVLKDGRTLPIHFRIETGVVPRVGPARSLDVTGLPATLVSGSAASVTVTARDENGNVALGYRGTIVFSSPNSSATLPAEYTFTEADAGTHTFANAVSFLIAGATTVRATDTDDETIVGEAPLTVQPGPATRLELSGLIDPSEAGAVNSIKVTARDVNGNVATGYTGTIAFTSNDPRASLPANYTFTAEDLGAHEFPASVTLRTAGARWVRATDADASIVGEAPITVLPSDAALLEVSGLDNPIQAGVAGSITVTAKDANGNVSAKYVGTVAFTSTDPQADLPPSYTFTAEDAGTHTFATSVKLRTAGSQTVTATDDAVSIITGAQIVTVTPAAATTLILTGIPDQSVAGVAYDFTLTAKDQFGNVATGYSGNVQFSSTDPAATFLASYAFQPGDAGVHSFPGGVTFKTAGPRTFQATDAAAASITTSVPTEVAAATAARLQFAAQPSDAIAGEAIAPAVVVTAYDAFANKASTFTGLVSMALGTNPAGGTLSGTTQVAAVAGVATFSALTIDKAGTGYTLVASSPSLTSATSDPFDVVAPTPVEVHWINPAGGNWSVGSNWSTGTPPTAEQTALIDLSGTYTVTMDVNASVNSLSVGAVSGVQTLTTVSGRTLTFLTSANVLSNGRLRLNGATVNGGGPLAIASGGVLTFVAVNALNAAVVNAGTLVSGSPPFSAAASITGMMTTVAGSLVRVHAGGSNTVTLTFANGFVNHGTIELTKANDPFGESRLAVTNGTLVNASDGVITSAVGTGGDRKLVAQLNNQGTLNVLQPLEIDRASSAHVNTGTIAVSGGSLTVRQSGTTPSFNNSGTISVAAGRALTILGGSFSLAAGATLDGAGSVSLSSVNPAAFSTAFTVAALSLSGTTASLAADFTTATTALSMINSTLNGPVTVTNSAGRTVTLSATNTVNTAFVNAGTLASGAPPFSSANRFNGTFSTVFGSLIRVQAGGSNSATLTFANGFVNHGTIELTKANDAIGGPTLAVTNGTLVNASDGVITSAVGTGGGRELAAQLDNQGTLNVLQPLEIDRASSAHVNTGTIAVSGGNLTVRQSGTTPSFSNIGTMSLATGRTLTIIGGSFTLAAGATLDGGGSVSLTSVNPAAFGAAFTVATLALNNTTASLAADFSAMTALNMTNSTLNGPVTVTNAAGRTVTLSATNTINTALVNAGTLVSGVPPFASTTTINGAFSTVAGSLIRVHGGSGSATLAFANGFVNRGAIELTKANDNFGGTTLSVQNGTLVNAPEGTITSVVGTGGSRTLVAQLDNQGALTVLHPLTLTRFGATHSNSGTITLTGGDLTIGLTSFLPTVTNSGTIEVSAGRAWRMSGGTFTNAAAGSITGAGTFEVGNSAPFNNAGSVTVALARIGNTLTSTGNFAPVTAEFFGAATTIPVGAGYTYTNVSLVGATATFSGPTSVAGNLSVVLNGTLTIGAQEVTVGGNFSTQSNGALRMQAAAGVLAISGNATFVGRSTNGLLTDGTIRVAGDFTQAGIAASFAASGNHLTVLNGSAAQTVSFANPGTATTLSHFQRLEIANSSAAGASIASNVFLNHTLGTPTGPTVARRIASTAGQTLQAAGLNADGLVFNNVPLRVVNGQPLTRFDNAVFQNMSLTATQFRLDRQNDVVTFNNVAFLTAPEGGVYLHLVDTDLVSPLFTVTMQGTQPANHAGKIIESVSGQLQGWPF